MNRTATGILWARRAKHMRAASSDTPLISNKMLPGLTTAAQYSGSPFPLPMRVSRGIEVIGLCGKARTKSRQAVREGLSEVRGFKGATGDITFNARRMPEKELFFLTVDDKGLREMTPAELAAGAPGG